MSESFSTKDGRHSLSSGLAPIREALWHAAGFSVFVNLMLLGPALYMLQVFDRVLASRSTATLGMLSVGVAIALIAMSIVDAIRSRLLVSVGRQVDELLGDTVLRHAVSQSSSPAPAAPSSALRDVAVLRGFFSGPNVIALLDAPWLPVYVLVISLLHPLMGLLALSGATLLMAVAWLAERANRACLNRLSEASRRASSFIDQGLRNADALNSMGMAGAFVGRWQVMNRDVLQLMQASHGRIGGLHAFSKFLRQAIQVGMLGLGAWLVLDSRVTPGIMIGATILFGRAMAPVEALIGNWSGLATAWNAYARLNQLMSGIQQNGMLTELPDPSGAIRLEGVSLAGLPGQPPILRQIGFDIAAGRSIGILGPSGAGKSSLAKIITGIWAPSGGVVRIDDADLAHWNKTHLGAHVGYLPQDVELFQGTIAENIARFEEDAGDAVLEAARQAGSYEMILRLPHGFDTRLGEGGIQLSAGQAQRIGLARALFRGPRIVVLDEPNANLDADGEQALIRTLVDLKQSGATVVMITHKPSLVATLDALLVLREGRVELIGPRDEVLARLYGSLTPNAPASPGKGVT